MKCNWPGFFISWLSFLNASFSLSIPIEFKKSTAQYKNESTPGMSLIVDQIVNYVENVPNPHLDVSADELSEFWQLAPMTVLSPLMKEIGRCRIAVELKIKEGVKVDPRMCNRIDSPWVNLVLVITSIWLFAYLIESVQKKKQKTMGFVEFIIRTISINDPSRTRQYLRFMLGLAMWDIPFLSYWFLRHDIGLSYTSRGYVYPSFYYKDTPIAWESVHGLIYFNCILQMIEAFIYFKSYWKNFRLKKRFENAKSDCEKTAVVTNMWEKWYKKYGRKTVTKGSLSHQFCEDQLKSKSKKKSMRMKKM